MNKPYRPEDHHQKAVDAEHRSAVWLSRANELAEGVQQPHTKASIEYAESKASYWLMQANKYRRW